MSEWKDKIRLSLGIIQEENGNNPLLEGLTKVVLESFSRNLKKSEGELWTRNSYEFKAHIPLLSDLDLTLFSASTATAKRLLAAKKKYLLIGEINFYHPDITRELVSLCNPYELSRDPILVNKLNMELKKTNAALTSFLLRQLYSDQKWLTAFPMVRKKKWQYIYQLIGKDLDGIPSSEKVLALLNKEDSANYLKMLRLSHEKNVFDISPKSSWRYLFPHYHIWWEQHAAEDDSYLKSLNDSEKEIMKEQIKWEFWGIGSHFYWLNQAVAEMHLQRLYKVYEYLNPTPGELDSMKKIINFIKQ